ncbi:hypothetical protein ACHAXS_003863 [Conticribra weissflogii]
MVTETEHRQFERVVDDDDDAVEVMRIGNEKEPTREANVLAKPPKSVGIGKVKELLGEKRKIVDDERRRKHDSASNASPHEHEDDQRQQQPQQLQEPQQLQQPQRQKYAPKSSASPENHVIPMPIPPNLRYPPLPSRQSSATDRKLRRTRSEPVKTMTPTPMHPSLPSSLPTASQNSPSVIVPTAPPPEFSSHDAIPAHTLLKRHYLPLQTEVVRRVEFPGLHTAEFFRVFFADDAPYSMREFQRKNGDVDIVYGEWTDVDLARMGGRCSFEEWAAVCFNFGAVPFYFLPTSFLTDLFARRIVPPIRSCSCYTTRTSIATADLRPRTNPHIDHSYQKLLRPRLSQGHENATSGPAFRPVARHRKPNLARRHSVCGSIQVAERWIIEAVRNDDGSGIDGGSDSHRNDNNHNHNLFHRSQNHNSYDTVQ